MITNLTAGPYITITNSTGGSFYSNNSNPLSGTVRYNNIGQVEVYDGAIWKTVSQSPTINLSSEAYEVLAWAMKKMQEEKDLEKKAKDNPAIRAAIERLRQAEEQLKTTLILSDNE